MKKEDISKNSVGVTNVFRSFALYMNALFPFLLPLKNYINGRVFRGIIMYFKDYASYVEQDRKIQSGFAIKWRNNFPILTERYEAAGSVPRHYFWQDLWAAKKVYKSKVPRHYDVGSRLDGFIAHCLPFCDVVMLDIRPLQEKIKNLSFIQVNCTDMSTILSDSLESFSSLHAVEHFGLGRYGDPIDPIGYKKAIMEIQRVVKPEGDIYFSVPVGVERLEFNAHRIFYPQTVLALFNQCDILDFSVVDDENIFHEKVDPSHFTELKYGCGLFHFQKRSILKTVDSSPRKT